MSTRPAHTDLPYSHAGDEDQARLEALSEALDPITISVLEALPDTGDAACLELGAGNGTIARWMADHLPSAQVTATELDLRHLEAEGRKNLDFVRHDVTQDQFPEAAFGLIHARWLLHHLPVREHVLPEITKWLAPGGHLVLEEPALFPLQAAQDEPYRRVSLGALTVLAQRVGTDCGTPSLNLARKLAELGLSDVTMRVTCPTVAVNTPAGRFWRLTLQHLADDIAQLPDIHRDDVTTVIQRLSQPGFLELGMATITVTGTKPRT
ncbi:class I SAM-dependent methyltransferase [Streptomyces sp. NPDC005900]|uniref:class I SAM-dependent methyltransferase n=1 Tax=Streptomyces sp. NPDC005900 TaxID=3154569 RepID=UPI0033DC1A1C